MINEPYLERQASNKVFQLQVAHSIGMEVPKTLVSSDPARIVGFVQEQWAAGHEVIYKAVSVVSSAQQSTQLLDRDMLQHLETARHCPTIIQRRAAGLDVRVTVVGSRLFAFEQVPVGEPLGVDGRFDEYRCVKIETPALIREQILRMQAELGLVFGAYDFKRADNGSFMFLEVNPTGQWLWGELGARLQIAEALAAALIDGPLTPRSLTHEPYLREQIPEIDSLVFDLESYSRALHSTS